ncbi:MAG TPA: VOC family protein [Segetibacter sp.]|jgi:PhnB protein
MTSLNPYLNFNGNTAEAFEFYKSVFGTEYLGIMRFKDVPPQFPFPESEGDKIMHVCLPLGNNAFLMGSDVPEAMGKVVTGNNFHISINADSKEEADKLFNNLSANGTVIMPMDTAFWGSYFGMLKDKFEVQWMISCELKQGN